ncbi:sugar porter family MFS transporter [Tsukamurella sp. 8F]|uniref:sugar porter family MFS transporter n=1 Tax=unclassified Tsukamurella TaxID=2633480 RepID=UPI0023B973C9|nr:MULTISPECIES: sugar porter family MFS transporter [unclassified Tsukamurella]MDF0529232.1 sugar porter family MFS transporter [Tsukamurella sp. 8J]MDF0585417.1 sugar porter family MFS transporter [Tsukamurella sp. 8F]
MSTQVASGTGRLGILVGVAAASLGIIYGYDTSNIGAAKDFITKQYDLGTTMTQAMASVVVVGEILGAILAGWLANRFGRKRSMVTVGACYAIFAVLSAVAPNPELLLVARFCLGLTVGVSVVVVPVFVAESAPSAKRGGMLVTYQFATIFGIILGYVLGYLFADAGFGDGAWRWMLGVAAIPAVIVTLVLLRLPDTARWYMSQGREVEARTTLSRIEPDGDVEGELNDMRRALADEAGGGLGELFRKPFLRATFFVVGLGFFIQITGINAIIYYSPDIFKSMGFEGDFGSYMLPAFVQVFGLVAVIVSLFTIDRFGRRPILLSGIAIMILAFVVMIVAYSMAGGDFGSSKSAGVLGFIGLVLVTVGFSSGFGSLVWVYAGEAFPARLRSLGSSAMLTSDLAANWIVAQFTLSLLRGLGGAWTFGLFGVLTVAAFAFVFKFAPETKGRKLEDIQHYWQNGGSWPVEPASGAGR